MSLFFIYLCFVSNCYLFTLSIAVFELRFKYYLFPSSQSKKKKKKKNLVPSISNVLFNHFNFYFCVKSRLQLDRLPV